MLHLIPATVLGLCLPARVIAHSHHNWFNESEQTSTKTSSRTDFMPLPDFALDLGSGSQGDKIQLILLMSVKFKIQDKLIASVFFDW